LSPKSKELSPILEKEEESDLEILKISSFSLKIHYLVHRLKKAKILPKTTLFWTKNGRKQPLEPLHEQRHFSQVE
jgi:hypothetical protein